MPQREQHITFEEGSIIEGRVRPEKDPRRGGARDTDKPIKDKSSKGTKKNSQYPDASKKRILAKYYSKNEDRFYDDYMAFVRFGHTYNNGFDLDTKQKILDSMVNTVESEVESEITGKAIEKAAKVIFGELGKKAVKVGSAIMDVISYALESPEAGTGADEMTKIYSEYDSFERYLENKQAIDKFYSDRYEKLRSYPNDLRFKHTGSDNKRNYFFTLP